MAIKKAPAFQFYAADYLADEHVQLMTLEEEGVYIRLLAYCWREGSIPADPKALSRLCKGASPEAISIVTDRFISMDNDAQRLTHPRLNEEREKQENWSQKNAVNGRKSGKARRDKKLQAERSFNESTNESRTKTNSSFASSSSSSSLNTNTPLSAREAPEFPATEELWIDGEPPPGLPMLAYARGLMENCFIPQDITIQQAVAAGIGAYGKEHAMAHHLATAELTKLARDALEQGESLNRWWFTDRKWVKKNGNGSRVEAKMAEIRRKRAEEADD